MCSILATFSYAEVLIASSILVAIYSTSYGFMIKAPCNALPQPENSDTIQALFSNLPCYYFTLTNSRGYKVKPSLKQVFNIILLNPQSAHLSSIHNASYFKTRQP